MMDAVIYWIVMTSTDTGVICRAKALPLMLMRRPRMPMIFVLIWAFMGRQGLYQSLILISFMNNLV